jgi:hypothetical protein
MSEFIITPSTPAPEIVVSSCLGDLRILGWERAEVRVEVKGDMSNVSAEQQNGRVAVSSQADLTLRVPHASSVTVGAVHSDARVKEVTGRVLIEAVHGDLVLRDVGPAQVGIVHGDLAAKEVAGSFDVNLVQGDAAVRSIAGPLTLGRIGSDLAAKALDAGGRAEDVQGDISLTTPFTPGADYRFRAQGDLVCRIEANTSARLEVRCHGDFSSAIPGLAPTGGDGLIVATLGAGEARVSLEAMGDLLLRPDDSSGGFNFNMNAMGIHVDVEQIRRDVERAKHEAMREVERMRRDAEHTKAHARRYARGFGRLGQWFSTGMSEPPTPPGQSGAPDEPVTEAERMAILRMVQEGQISAADAAKLLEALGE